MGSKREEYCNLYRLTNNKTGETFEARKWRQVLIKAGLCETTAPTVIARSKKWNLEKLAGPLHWDEEQYRADLYKRTRSEYHRYERAKLERDPLFEKRKRLKQQGWVNIDGTPFTAEQHSAMAAQPCEVCGSRKKIKVDHCHETNVVRGTLCNHCNIGLGHLRDNVDILERMIQYLKKHQEKIKCSE